MTAPVAHYPRVAWDAASMIARALSSDQACYWLGQRLDRLLGPAWRRALFESRNRMWASERPDAPQVECGLWRARLEDLLRTHPELIDPVRALVPEAGTVVDQATDRRDFFPVPAPEPAGVIDLDRFR
jgi:hypothetical protein